VRRLLGEPGGVIGPTAHAPLRAVSLGAIVIGLAVGVAGHGFVKIIRRAKSASVAPGRRVALVAVSLAVAVPLAQWMTGSPVLFGSGAAMYRWAVGANSFAVLAVVTVFVALVAVMVFGGVVGGLFLPMVSIGSTLAVVVVGFIATDTPRLVASTIGGCAMVAAAYGTPLTAVALGVSRLGPSWSSVAMVVAVGIARSVSSPESVSIYQDATHVRS
jgi:H+/Cl- antiporter ClcA